MFGPQRLIFAGLMTAFTLGALTTANAQATHGRAHRKVLHPTGQSVGAPPVRPNDELQTSTSVSVGSESRYMTDSIGAGSASSMGQDGRAGNRLPSPNSSMLNFSF